MCWLHRQRDCASEALMNEHISLDGVLAQYALNKKTVVQQQHIII